MTTFLKLKRKKKPIKFVRGQLYLANLFGRWVDVVCIGFEPSNPTVPILRPPGSELGYTLDHFDAIVKLIDVDENR